MGPYKENTSLESLRSESMDMDPSGTSDTAHYTSTGYTDQ